MNSLHEFLAPYLISNGFAVFLWWLAWRSPRMARWIAVIVFGGAAAINLQLALQQPEVYLEYGTLTPSELYREFIGGWFSDHIRPMVTVIAAGQVTVAALLLAPKPWRTAGVAGACIFLLAIAPLGIGSAFPFSLIFIAAMLTLHRKETAVSQLPNSAGHLMASS